MSNVALPKKFWGEALMTATYLINKCPSSAIGLKTPIEKWSGHPPDLSNLRVFGCVAYAHSREGKLDNRAKKCLFLGYPQGVKGYRLWCIEKGEEKCIISRDVTFDESIIAYKSEAIDTNSPNTETIIVEMELEGENSSPAVVEEGTVSETPADIQPESSSSETTNLQTYNLARDRQRREIRPPSRYARADLVHYALNVEIEQADTEPLTYSEAVNSRDSVKWQSAMDDEMDSLMKNHTWDLVERPLNQKLVGCKWIYKLKKSVDSTEPIRFKARLVAKGYTQKEGVDYDEIFSPVVRHSSIRVLLSLVTANDMELDQMDVVGFLE
ncbi:MAG: reverse transcriptase domain-containing protein [Sweet potato little leaf phytoplasma]|nr:reverse transcriptase domain-containing protein [Sweet potato little leaf phytoplasma]